MCVSLDVSLCLTHSLCLDFTLQALSACLHSLNLDFTLQALSTCLPDLAHTESMSHSVRRSKASALLSSVANKLNSPRLSAISMKLR